MLNEQTNQRVTSRMGFYGEYEDEILSLTQEEYNKLLCCPNCLNSNREYIDRFPDMENKRLKFNFMTFRCLCCGRFCSLSKNYERQVTLRR